MNRDKFKKLVFNLFIAIGLSTLGALLRIWPLNFLLDTNFIFITFYPAVMISSVYGGMYLGILTTLISSLYAYLLALNNINLVQDSAFLIGTLLFYLNGLIFSIVGGILLQTKSRMQNAIKKANSLAEALEGISSYVYIKDHNACYVYANRQTLSLFGCTSESLIGKTDQYFFPSDAANHIYNADSRVLSQGISIAEELIVTQPDGKKVFYWDVKTPIYNDHEKKQIIGLCGISTDITNRKNQEAALQESEDRFRSMFSSAAIGMAQVSLNGYFLEANTALCALLGYSNNQLKQLTINQITYPDDLNSDNQLIQQLFDGQSLSYQVEKRYVHKDGRIIWSLVTSSVVHDNQNKIKSFIVQVIDITERRLLLDKLELQAHQDYLTELNNRRYFFELGELEFERAKRFNSPLSALMLDIDDFKIINDTYGHKTGDLLLKTISDILKKTLRKIDIIGRLGGEEFGIILPETTVDSAIETAERLRNTIVKTPIILKEGLPIHHTISIGVSTVNEINATLDILLNDADRGLYQAKNNGKNQIGIAENQ